MEERRKVQKAVTAQSRLEPRGLGRPAHPEPPSSQRPPKNRFPAQLDQFKKAESAYVDERPVDVDRGDRRPGLRQKHSGEGGRPTGGRREVGFGADVAEANAAPTLKRPRAKQEQGLAWLDKSVDCQDDCPKTRRIACELTGCDLDTLENEFVPLKGGHQTQQASQQRRFHEKPLFSSSQNNKIFGREKRELQQQDAQERAPIALKPQLQHVDRFAAPNCPPRQTGQIFRGFKLNETDLNTQNYLSALYKKEDSARGNNGNLHYRPRQPDNSKQAISRPSKASTQFFDAPRRPDRSNSSGRSEAEEGLGDGLFGKAQRAEHFEAPRPVRRPADTQADPSRRRPLVSLLGGPDSPANAIKLGTIKCRDGRIDGIIDKTSFYAEINNYISSGHLPSREPKPLLKLQKLPAVKQSHPAELSTDGGSLLASIDVYIRNIQKALKRKTKNDLRNIRKGNVFDHLEEWQSIDPRDPGLQVEVFDRDAIRKMMKGTNVGIKFT